MSYLINRIFYNFHGRFDMDWAGFRLFLRFTVLCEEDGGGPGGENPIHNNPLI